MGSEPTAPNPAPRGLPNPGWNTCYLNSVLQAFHATGHLRRHISRLAAQGEEQQQHRAASLQFLVSQDPSSSTTSQQLDQGGPRAFTAYSDPLGLTILSLIKSLACLLCTSLRSTDAGSTCIALPAKQPATTSITSRQHSYTAAREQTDQQQLSSGADQHSLGSSTALPLTSLYSSLARHPVDVPLVTALSGLLDHMSPGDVQGVKSKVLPLSAVQGVIAALQSHLPEGSLRFGNQEDALEAMQALLCGLQSEADVLVNRSTGTGLLCLSELGEARTVDMHFCSHTSDTDVSDKFINPADCSNSSQNGTAGSAQHAGPTPPAQPAVDHASNQPLVTSQPQQAAGDVGGEVLVSDEQQPAQPQVDVSHHVLATDTSNHVLASDVESVKHMAAGAHLIWPSASPRLAAHRQSQLPACGWAAHSLVCCECGNSSLTQITPSWSLSLKLPHVIDEHTGLAHVLPGADLLSCLKAHVQPCLIRDVTCNKCSLKKLTVALQARFNTPHMTWPMSNTASRSGVLQNGLPHAPITSNGAAKGRPELPHVLRLAEQLSQLPRHVPLPDLDLDDLLEDEPGRKLLRSFKVRCNALQYTGVPQLGDVLLLHMQRSVWSPYAGTCVKVYGQLRFPVLLPDAVLRAALGQQDHSTEHVWRLTSVISHLGSAARSGHYVVYRRGSSKGSSTWFRVSDGCVTQATHEQVQDCQASVLVYERCVS